METVDCLAPPLDPGVVRAASMPPVAAAHVIAGLDPAHGGTSYSVPRLCEALAAVGASVSLLSVATTEGDGDRSDKGYCDRRFPWDYRRVPWLHAVRRSAGLSQALRGAAETVDVIHNHGLWLLPNVAAGRIARQTRRPLVISPRGMLAPAALAFSHRKKQLFWCLLQAMPVRHAACLHATSDAEYEEIRAFGLTNPVAIIPNGVDLPEPPPAAAAASSDDPVVLSLGRIHPKKGLDRLLHAWHRVEADHPRWSLRIVGPSEGGHDRELRALAASLGLARVSIEGPVYGAARDVAYRAAALFVLATLNENFGLTVAEALAAGIPVIATRGAPWGGLATESCGWWVDHGVEPLAAALAGAMALPPAELRAMGARGQAWMARDFSWQRAAGDMLDVYRWIAGAAEAPPVLSMS